MISINLMFQVSAVELLLAHLPRVGCSHCIYASPPAAVGVPEDCCCDDVFLVPRRPINWRATDAVWFGRCRQGVNWFKTVVKTVTHRAGCAGKYTNGCLRPTAVTQLAAAGYSNKVIQQMTGHKSSLMVEAYKRQNEFMRKEERRELTMLTSSSGRDALRGGLNQWGEVLPSAAGPSKLVINHRAVVHDRVELEQVGKEGWRPSDSQEV